MTNNQLMVLLQIYVMGTAYEVEGVTAATFNDDITSLRGGGYIENVNDDDDPEYDHIESQAGARVTAKGQLLIDTIGRIKIETVLSATLTPATL